MLNTTAFALAFLALPVAQQDPDALELESRIASVDVYPNTALVTRTGDNPRGDGIRLVRGLPKSLVVESVRVRAPGAEIVALEVLERWEKTVPDAKIADAAARLELLVREHRVALDELDLVALLAKHFTTLLEEQARGEAALGLEPAQRMEAIALAREQLTALAAQRRELGWKLQELEGERDRLQSDIGRWQQGESTKFYDLQLDLLDTDGEADLLEIEYQVTGARWEPYYDLRADAGLTSVDLVYRARVHQRTGEDWDGVQLALSTALPQRGLHAPQARIHWLDLYQPMPPTESSRAERPSQDYANLDSLGYLADREVGAASDVRGLAAFVSEDASRASTGMWAQIVADGVNLRYALPRAQDVPSRPEPSSVLVGRQALDVEMERVCLPAIDPTVWLRGRATNTSPWVLLEGQASIYLGSNYLGTTAIARVQTGAEFDVPLGQDPGVQVERVQTEDRTEQPGIFGSKVTRFETFKINATNTSASAISLIVHESLPRARDERIDVAVDRAVPALSKNERFAKLGEERGLATWVVEIPAGGERGLELRLKVGYPQSRTLVAD